MKARMAIVSIVGGIVISAVTGWIPGYLLFTVTGGLQVLAGELLGASNYGLPLVWRTVVVYPGSPAIYHIVGLVVDIAVWALVTWLILGVSQKRKK